MKVKHIKEVKRRKGAFGANVKLEARQMLRALDDDEVQGVSVCWHDKSGNIYGAHAYEDRLKHIGALEFLKLQAWKL